MKALTLPQPLATLIAIGAKLFESPAWPAQHHGLLALHAASRLTPLGREHALWGPVHKLLATRGFADPEALPLGAIVGVVEVLEARRTSLRDMAELPKWERQLGTYHPGRTIFRFGLAQLAPAPIAAAGRQGLWEWTPPEGDAAAWWAQEPVI